MPAKKFTILALDVRTGYSSDPKVRRRQWLTENMGGNLSGWTAKELRMAKVGEVLRCDATHHSKTKLLVVVTNEALGIERAVGLGFARKYLGLKVKDPRK